MPVGAARVGVFRQLTADAGVVNEDGTRYRTDLQGLRNYFPLDESSGAAEDIIGGGTSIDQDNHPTQGVSGVLDGTATEFSASNSEAFEFGSEGQFNNITALGWTTWSAPDTFAAIFGNMRYNDSAGWFVGWESTSGVLSVDAFPGGTRVQVTGGDVDDGAWHLVGCRWDGSNWDLLIDGSVVGTDSSESGNLNYTNAENFHIGRRPDGGNWWDGKVDHVMVFDEAISDTLHQDIYDAGAS